VPGVKMGQGSDLMDTDRSDQTASSLPPRSGAVAVLSLAVAVVLGDAGVVTLALPEILREFGAAVGEVAWVLIAFNLVLALVAVPAARVCVRGNPATVTAGGLIGFAAATTVCAVAPSLGVLIAARAAQAAGGALVIVGSLELLVAATEAERAGVRRWATAGVVGAALGPVVGGLLTSAFSWRAIFVAQIPAVLLALPAAIALRHRVVRRESNLDTSPDRPHVMANLALALLSAALTAALFLLVLLLVDGWSHSPAVAAVAVTAVPVAALAAGPVFRGVRAGTRSEAVAGSVLIAGGLTGLALLPSAELVWTLAPQVLIGLGLGLSVDSLTAAALRERVPRALHGGWTIAARHAGVVVGLAILTPIFTADLHHAETPAKEAIARLVLDAPLPASTKLDLAERLGRQLLAERGRVPDLRPAFENLRLPAKQAPAAAALESGLEDQLKRAATRAFRTAFLVAAVLGLLALGPALALRDRSLS
jgi:predicted MFS family arabinose efflux permease